MITNKIIEFFLGPILYLLEVLELPEIEPLVIPERTFYVLLNIVRPLGYFLPMNLICTCIAFSVALDHFNIFWALFLRIKSFASVRNWL